MCGLRCVVCGQYVCHIILCAVLVSGFALLLAASILDTPQSQASACWLHWQGGFKWSRKGDVYFRGFRSGSLPSQQRRARRESDICCRSVGALG